MYDLLGASLVSSAVCSELSNYDAANVLVIGGRPTLVQRLGRAFTTLCFEHPALLLRLWGRKGYLLEDDAESV
jgi:hypothetical protein